MRLKKFSLIAAAGLSAVVSLSAATAGATLDGTVRTFGADVAVPNNSTLTIDVDAAATWAGKITGAVQNPNAAQPMLDPGYTSGTVIKTGDGTLQLDSYKNIAYYQGSFIENVLPAKQVMLSDASQGMLRVKAGNVEVGGYINQYVDTSDWARPSNPTSVFKNLQFVDGPLASDGFLGFGATVLEGNSRISFTNTPLNVPNALPSLDGAAPDLPPLPRVKRLNFIVNLKAGDNHTEVNTRLNVGQTEDMRLICHVTEEEVQAANSTGMGVVGSVGILEGRGGQFIKTGGGEFRLLNKATFTGNVIVEEGILTLNRDNALETARSVNLGSPDDPRGDVFIGGFSPATREFSPFLVPHSPSEPLTGEYVAKLKVEGDQRINNLQALAKPANAFGVIFSPSEVYGTRTGRASAIDIADGRTLTINQVYNGYYSGKFISTYRAGDADLGSHAVGSERESGQGGGNIVKYGVAETREDETFGTVYTKGTLVLDGPGSIYRNLDIREGVVFANVQSLGAGDVYVQSGGVLRLIQNDVGTLKAHLHGLGELRFAKIGYLMTNGSALDGGDVSNGDPVLAFMGTKQIGTADIFVAQDDFRGDIVIQDGLQLRFSAAGGNAFRNANSLTLITGTNGEETALTFNDTNQIFRNFSGERETRVDLGQGNITIIQDNLDLTYEGKITGSGGLIKDGAKSLTLSGRDEQGNSVTTYAGATVVKNGALLLGDEKLGGVNQLPNTSGLVMLGGSVVVTGAQRFGALFGTAGSTLDMGANDLTIGVTDARLAQIRASVGALTSPNNSYYLATDGSTVVSGYTGQTTRDFLQSVGMSAADAATMAFAGSITGSGRLIKEGAERLILTGVNTYTGATVINGGTLQVNVGSIDSSSSVTVAAGANFAVNVDSGSGEFNRVVQGAGNFEKTGAGTLTLGQDVYQYSGTTTVSGGTLVVTLNPAMTGAILIAPGATLAANQPLDTTFGTSIVSTVTGNGTFQKDGGGLLYLTNFTGFTGLARVNEGILRVDTLSPTSVEVGLGATFLLTPTAAVPAYTGSVSGAGTFAVRGQSIAFGASNAGFTGTLSGENTTIVASVDDIFPLATVSLVNSVFSIDGTVQHLARFTGDVVSSVNLGTTGSLHFAPGEGVDAAFGGIINGTGGSIVKDGTGTQRLTTPLNTGWTGRTIVNEGTLVATVDALGNSALTINAGTNLSALGTLSFLNEDSDNPATYAGVIAGDGVIGKTGVGVVNLTNVSAAFSGSIAVTQGELHVSSSGIGGKLFGDTSVATGGIYAVALPGDTAHDSSVAGNRVSDMITPDGVAQHGSLAVEGPFVFRLLNGQSYTGNTILRQGVTLDLVNSTGLNGVLAGLAGESGTTVRTDGAALTIVQSVDGVFSGAFNTTTDLTVKGAGKLAMDNISNNIGTITVDGGRLALDASLGNTVNLVNGGTLYFDTTNFNQVYAGPVVGDGNMLKTGEGTLSLLNSTDFANLLGFDGGLGSDQGRLEVSVAALLSTAPNVTKLISEGKGEVALQVGAGETQSLTMAMTGDGSYFKTGDGKLVLGTAANPYTIDATGTFTIERGVVGGYFSTSGDLVVGPDGTLAPGNSPGTVTVNGNFTSYGTLALELNATTSDKIVVNGAATLAAGTKFLVTQDNTPGSTAPVRGKAYQVITATGGIFAQEGDFTVDLSNPANRRVIILTPGRYNTLFAYNPNIPHDANSVYIYDAPSLAGFSPHDGLSGFVGRLDDYIVGRLDGTNVALGLPSNALGGALAFAPESSLAQTINNLSPLGYASLYTMSRDTALRQEDRLKERLEQRRYDNGGYSWADWEAFVVGAAGMADNRTAADTPVFDYKTYGGMVGLDKKIEDGLFVGGAAGYDNGTASLHQDGGKIDMNRVRGTAFMSTMVTKRWFVDGGLSAGFGDFSSKRNTALGRVTGSTTGFDLGLNVSTGTVLVLREDLHLTPFVGVSYAHHEFQGFTEKGADSVLKLDGWSQDSLRTSLGTGLGWWVPSGDWKWKFGVDVAYNHELLDTDSDIDASFARLGGGKFGTTAAALPSDTVSFSPNVALNFDEETSVSAGVTFEYGFDGRTYGGINVAFRRRF